MGAAAAIAAIAAIALVALVVAIDVLAVAVWRQRSTAQRSIARARA